MIINFLFYYSTIVLMNSHQISKCFSFVPSNLKEWCITISDSNLGDSNNGINTKFVLSQWMPELLVQASKVFELAVSCLVSASNPLLHFPLTLSSSKAALRWKINTLCLSFVAIVGFCLFTFSKEHGLQAPTENFDIWKLSCWEGPMNPNNVT